MILGLISGFVLVVSLCATVVFAPVNITAQDLNPIQWRIKPESVPPRLKPGDRFELRVSAKIDDGWHLYSLEQPQGGPLPTRIGLPEGQDFKLAGTIGSPLPLVLFDPNFNLDTQFYEREAEFTLPIEVFKSAAPGKQTLIVSAYFQTCNDTKCLPPKAVKMTTVLEIVVANKGEYTPAVKAPNELDKTNPADPTKKDELTGIVEFDFVDFAGKKRKLSEFRGKYVLLDFWATWCKPCLVDIPKLKSLYEKYKSSGFEIIGMDSETIGDEAEAPDPEFAKQAEARARQIVSTRGIAWTQAMNDTAVPVAIKVFGVKALPTKVMIDREGRIVATIGEKDDLAGIVETLLSTKQ